MIPPSFLADALALPHACYLGSRLLTCIQNILRERQGGLAFLGRPAALPRNDMERR